MCIYMHISSTKMSMYIYIYIYIYIKNETFISKKVTFRFLPNLRRLNKRMDKTAVKSNAKVFRIYKKNTS